MPASGHMSRSGLLRRTSRTPSGPSTSTTCASTMSGAYRRAPTAGNHPWPRAVGVDMTRETTDRSYAVDRTDEEWRATLSPEEYQVLRRAGTERPYTGEYTDAKTEGVYAC